MKRQRRAFDGSNLSFLDVISCGFGAVVLLVLIAKTLPNPADNTGLVEDMLARLARMQAQSTALEDQLKARTKTAERAAMLRDSLQKRAKDTQAATESVRRQNAALQQDITEKKASRHLSEKQQPASGGPRAVPDEEVGGIPVDSDYVIFIVDTSGSMQYIWSQVSETIEHIIEIHPKIKGFQILSDNGAHLLSGYRGRWIPDTPRSRARTIKLFKTWNSVSNSSPVEGLEAALKTYVTPQNKVSLYVFGDEYTGASFNPVMDTLDRLNAHPTTGAPMARVHGVGFMSSQPTGRYARLMREVTRRNNGTFLALPRGQTAQSAPGLILPPAGIIPLGGTRAE